MNMTIEAKRGNLTKLRKEFGTTDPVRIYRRVKELEVEYNRIRIQHLELTENEKKKLRNNESEMIRKRIRLVTKKMYYIKREMKDSPTVVANGGLTELEERLYMVDSNLIKNRISEYPDYQKLDSHAKQNVIPDLLENYSISSSGLASPFIEDYYIYPDGKVELKPFFKRYTNYLRRHQEEYDTNHREDKKVKQEENITIRR